jgi:hypothetical protein
MCSAYYMKLTNSVACDVYVHYLHSKEVKPSTRVSAYSTRQESPHTVHDKSLRIQYTTGVSAYSTRQEPLHTVHDSSQTA